MTPKAPSANPKAKSATTVPEIEGWTIEWDTHCMVRGSMTRRLEPKTMRLLQYLIERAGETISKDELIDAVWEGTHVEDNAISRAVSQVRKAFDDSSRNSRVIATIPKRGYRLIAPITWPMPAAAPRQTRLSLVTEPAAPHGPGATTDPVPAEASDSAVTAPDTAPPPDTDDVASSPHPVRIYKPRPVPTREMLPTLVVRILFLTVLASLLILAFWSGRRSAEPSPVAETQAPLPGQPLTSLPGLETDPAISPDGQRIAFRHQPLGETRGQLYVRQIREEGLLQLTHETADHRNPAWSPDGQTLYFLRSDDTGRQLCRVSALGGQVRVVRKLSRGPQGLVLHPDGKRAIFSQVPENSSGSGSPPALHLLDLEDQSLRVLTRPPATGTGDQRPAISHDGRKLAFIRKTIAEHQDLHLMNLEDGPSAPPRRLTHDASFLAGISWAPDDSAILFSSNRTGLFGLWRLDLDAEKPRFLPGLTSYDPGMPIIRPEGRGLVYEEWFFDTNLWRANLEEAVSGEPGGSPIRQVSTHWEYFPRHAPDGRHVAFVTNRSGSPEIWLAPADDTTSWRFSQVKPAIADAPSWSPDGSRLAFEVRDRAGSRIQIGARDGSDFRFVTPADSRARFPVWRDGDRLVFTSDRSGSWELWQTSANGGPETPAERLTEHGGWIAAFHPDGDRLIYTRFGETGWWQRDFATGAEVPLALDDALDLGAISPGNWQVRGRNLYFVKRTQPSGYALMVWHLDDHRLRTLCPLPHTFGLGPAAFSIGPTERELWFVNVDRLESDLWYVDDYELKDSRK